RLTREYFEGADPPTTKQISQVNDYIHSVLKDYRSQFPKKLPENTVVTGTSKTFRSLARVAGAAPSTDGMCVQRKLSRNDLGRWVSCPGRHGSVQGQTPQDLPLGVA